MTAALEVAVVALAIIATVLLVSQRRAIRRLLAVVERLPGDVTATGSGLGEVTAVVERSVDRLLMREGETSDAEARLATALSAIPQGVLLFDGEGEVVFRNQHAHAYAGARHEDALVEEAINRLVGEVIRGAAVAPVRSMELFGPPARSLSLRAVSLSEEASGARALVVVDDVTERRRLEAVRRDFVANVSHELKTPVGALGLLAETLVAEDDPTLARRLGERMLAEAFRVARIIDDLLELSRIESDDTTVREPVPVSVVVSEALDRVRGAAEARDIALQIEAVPPHLTVAGDRRQLVSAAYNLLDNAVKYSEPGSTVSVSARTDGTFVDLAVADSGTGIPTRDLERIFERFYRVDRARSRETGGTGLGLAIVRHVAHNHSGEIQVSSQEGAGSTFTLRLPLGGGPVAVTAEAG